MAEKIPTAEECFAKLRQEMALNFNQQRVALVNRVIHTPPQRFAEVHLEEWYHELWKMAATAALKIAHDAGKLPFLPKALPVGVITNVACVGVEAFKSIYQVSTGKMTRLQAAENVGRAAVVAIADLCASGLPAKLLMPIPVVGPALSFGVSTLLMASSSETIQQTIYAGIEALTPVAKQIAANILKSNEVTATTNTVSNTVRAGVNF